MQDAGSREGAKPRSFEERMTILAASFEFRLNDDTCSGLSIEQHNCRKMKLLRQSTDLYELGGYYGSDG